MRGKTKWASAVAMLLLASVIAAGCGTNQTGGKAGGQDTEKTADKDSSGTQTNADAGSDADTEEKTEIRREDFPDCDGSGHGYVEIYYSDGSMETEEY